MITITHIDTACILLDINGFKILTDPTLDEAGKLYYHGYGSISRKTGTPALQHVDLSDVDLVLLSHHQHKDNFDNQGKAFAAGVSIVLSTRNAAKALAGITGMDEWESYLVYTAKVPGLKITATPAQHHPDWVPGFLSGKVIGFIIEFDEQRNGVIYITGDTVFFRGIEEVARRYTIDIGIFHVGSVQFRYLTGFGKYTMDSKDLLKAVHILQPNTVIPIHHKGWTHFKEKESVLQSTLRKEQDIYARTLFVESGIPYQLQ